MNGAAFCCSISDEDDNKQIGIILCTDKDALTVEYSLGGLSNNIFASNSEKITLEQMDDLLNKKDSFVRDVRNLLIHFVKDECFSLYNKVY